MKARFSSPSVLLARGGSDLLSKAHALSRSIHATEHPEEVEELGIVATRAVGGDKERAQTILRRAVVWGLERLGEPQMDRPWTLRVSESDPNEPLVQYFPDDAVLEMQQRALEEFREVDMVVVAVHELLGHHIQETRVKRADRDYYITSRRDTQEGCAMACEKTLLTGPLERVGLEWKLFRVLRALEVMGKTTLWELFPEGHRMPREYVQSYVQSLPGQAQHYVFTSSDEYCAC